MAESVNVPTPALEKTEVRLELLLKRLETSADSPSSARLDAELDDILNRERSIAPQANALPRRRSPEKRRRARFMWFQEISASSRLLTEDEVAEAARAVEVGLFARERLEKLHTAVVDRQDLADLWDLAEAGDKAFSALILSNLRLVFHWSKGIARKLDENWAQDAFQAGCLGLMRGLQSWDYDKGYKLSTYVSWHVRQSIQRWKANEVSLVRLPVHVWDQINSDAGVKDPKLQLLIDHALNVLAIETLDRNNQSLAWDGGVEEAIEANERSVLVHRMLDVLNEREAGVLRMRFGLATNDGEPKTLDQIGEVFGVTRERIRQIEFKTMKKLRELAALPSHQLPLPKRPGSL